MSEAHTLSLHHENALNLRQTRCIAEVNATDSHTLGGFGGITQGVIQAASASGKRRAPIMRLEELHQACLPCFAQPRTLLSLCHLGKLAMVFPASGSCFSADRKYARQISP